MKLIKNEMKNYKSVLVHIGYAESWPFSVEYWIEGVRALKDDTLQSAFNSVKKTQFNEMLKDDDSLHEDDYNEFLGHGSIEKGVGILQIGEENLLLVLEETNEWYNKIDNFPDWDNETFEKWNEFLISL
jgi:hypothetical protein